MNNASDESKFNANIFTQNPNNANYFRIFDPSSSSSGRSTRSIPQSKGSHLDPNDEENYDFFPKSQRYLERNPDVKTSLPQLTRSLSQPTTMNLESKEIKLS